MTTLRVSIGGALGLTLPAAGLGGCHPGPEATETPSESPGKTPGAVSPPPGASMDEPAAPTPAAEAPPLVEEPGEDMPGEDTPTPPEREEELPESAQCGPAQDKLIELVARGAAGVQAELVRNREAWITACETRVESGDKAFRKELRCVAEAPDVDTLIRCDGWTDWPAM